MTISNVAQGTIQNLDSLDHFLGETKIVDI